MAAVYPVSSYSLATIAVTVASSSASPTYIWQAAVPAGAKGKVGILQLFFNLYNSTNFFANQTFNYGIYVDGVALSIGDSTTITYTQTAATSYAISSSGVLRGTNGFHGYNPLLIPVSFSSSAQYIQLGISNSSLALSSVSSASPHVGSNVTVSSGTLNTGNYIPINTFTTTGTFNYTVPTTVQGGSVVGVYVYLWGAGGGPGGSPSAGGGGGFTSGFYSCSGGSTLTYIVGACGGGAFSNGYGGVNNSSGAGVGPSGPSGGFSGIFSTATASLATVIGIAGGGGSGDAQMNGGNGGGGGGSNGGAGWNYVANAYQGGGGTQTGGGAGYSDGYTGSQWYGGGNGWGTASKGGAGWYGGGSGGPGGGGGSGYTSNFTSGGLTQVGTTLLGSTATPSLATPAGTSSPYFVSGYGNGSGTGGFVVIVPAIGTNANQIGVQANIFVV